MQEVFVKSVALVICPWVFFVLQRRLKDTLIAFLPILMLNIFITTYSDMALLAFAIVATLIIFWVQSTQEYKGLKQFPKNSLLAVFFPFVVLFQQKRFILGMVCACGWLLGLFILLAVSSRAPVHPTEDVIFFLCILFLLNVVYLRFLWAIFKGIIEAIEGQSDLDTLIKLETNQRESFLKSKTLKEIDAIRASLKELPIDVQIPIKKAIKAVLEEWERT
ncbi:hypothetical protein [Helicobacter felis]|uniref:hypothetical protein n=1 Tax=Helicobacter felis TaxID=214 RepID=UPI001F48AC14|nr:hypothetical protein [Helicobacter felis]